MPHLSCMEVLCVAGFESLPHNTSILCEPCRREEWVSRVSIQDRCQLWRKNCVPSRKRSMRRRSVSVGGRTASSIVDQAFSIWYHHPIQDTGYYLWRRLPRAASLERRCRDEQKRTPRNIDTQHEGMELHRGCPGNVDAEISFRVIPFLITSNRNLLALATSEAWTRHGVMHFKS